MSGREEIRMQVPKSKTNHQGLEATPGHLQVLLQLPRAFLISVSVFLKALYTGFEFDIFSLPSTDLNGCLVLCIY